MKLPSMLEFTLMALIGPNEIAGRPLAKLYKQETGKAISYGTLYTTLRRLIESGLVACREDEDKDGRLRFFVLTAQGHQVLTEARLRYEELVRLGKKVRLPKEALA
jgi:DNA-binding PadR family transcriptional regulator